MRRTLNSVRITRQAPSIFLHITFQIAQSLPTHILPPSSKLPFFAHCGPALQSLPTHNGPPLSIVPMRLQPDGASHAADAVVYAVVVSVAVCTSYAVFSVVE
jgi:hypothetical protein